MNWYYVTCIIAIIEPGSWITVECLPQEKPSSSVMQRPSFDLLLDSKIFVDKSLVIKEVLQSPHHTNLILAPKTFGKTTNLEMIKRFFKVEVDENGCLKDKPLSSRFNGKGLKILKDNDFVDTHFATYPILHLDYSSLSTIDSYEHLFEKLIVVISRAYSEHDYLLKNDSLWAGFEKGLFQSYVIAKDNHKDHNTHILTSLTWLVEILYKHFNRKVIVLIDDFDAYVHSAIFKDSKGIDKILKLMMEIDSKLLRPNDFVKKVILTGSLKIYREDMTKDIWTYHFLEDHPFSQYFGLTKIDVEALLEKLVSNCGEKYGLLNDITSYYGSYKIFSEENSVTEIYNPWAVINYILERKHSSDYLIDPGYLQGFKTIFRAQTVKIKLQALILGENVNLDIRLPFKEEDIRTLNYIVKSYICPPSGVEVFLRLLYSFGYLTQVKENKGLLLEEFKIPNNATYDELMRYTPV